MKKSGYQRQPFNPPYPVSHTIDGEKMPPDGMAQPLPDDGDPPHMISRPVGNAAPAGDDFGPYIDYLGEGLFHSFKLDFTNQIPYSTGGVHPHTGLLLFALALNIRPDVIIETGTFIGYSTFFLAQACRFWRKGRVYTLDPDQKIIADQIKCNPFVECIPEKSVTGLVPLLQRVGQVDMAFLDSWKRLALWEFVMIEPYIVEGGCVVFHDTQLFNDGRTLYDIIEADFPQYDKMLFAGIPHIENTHRYHGNADDRGLYVLRKRNEDPFLDVRDADSDYFGKQQVVPHLGYLPIRVNESVQSVNIVEEERVKV